MSEINKSERLVCLLIPFRIDCQFDIIVSPLMFFKFRFHITFFIPTRNISNHDSCTLFLTNYEKMFIYWSSLTKVISCNDTCLRILLLNTICCWYRIVQRVWSCCWKFLIIKWLFSLLYFSWCVQWWRIIRSKITSVRLSIRQIATQSLILSKIVDSSYFLFQQITSTSAVLKLMKKLMKVTFWSLLTKIIMKIFLVLVSSLFMNYMKFIVNLEFNMH